MILLIHLYSLPMCLGGSTPTKSMRRRQAHRSCPEVAVLSTSEGIASETNVGKTAFCFNPDSRTMCLLLR